MASGLQLVAIADTGIPDPDWLVEAADLLDHLEACWSRFLPTSDVSRMNLAGGQPVAVDPSTITLIGTMIDAWRLTERRFDPTTLPALMAAGYRASIDDPRRITLLPDGAIDIEGLGRTDARLGHPTLDDVMIDRDAGTICLPIGLTVDAGGIGKGLAADLAVAGAVRAGADGAMASIGGDIAMAGRPPEGGWSIHLEHPRRQPELVGTFTVNSGGVATSSTTSRRWQHDGGEHHHVIDPWTGVPSTTDLASVTVVARSGWLAEAHATAAILAGSDHVLDHLDRHDLSGLAVTTDGLVLATDDLSTLRSELATSTQGGVQ